MDQNILITTGRYNEHVYYVILNPSSKNDDNPIFAGYVQYTLSLTNIDSVPFLSLIDKQTIIRYLNEDKRVVIAIDSNVTPNQFDESISPDAANELNKYIVYALLIGGSLLLLYILL